MTEGSRHLPIYDWAKAMVILWVVCAHSVYLAVPTPLGGVAYSLPEGVNPVYFSPVFELWRILSVFPHQFSMALFFMLSGAVMALKPLADFSVMLRSKVKRLLVPFFLSGFCFMIPVKYISGFYKRDVLKDVYMDLLVGGGESGHLWFLGVLLWCFILFYFFKWISDSICPGFYWGPLFLAGAVQILHDYLFGSMWPLNPFWPFSVLLPFLCLHFVFWFTFGFYFEKKRQQCQQWKLQSIILLAAGVHIAAVLVYYMGCPDGYFKLITYSAAVYCMALLCSRTLDWVTQTAVWEVCMRNLLCVYLFHDPLEYAILRLFFGQGYLTSWMGCVMYFVSRTILVVVVSIVLGELVGVLRRKVKRHFAWL